jgi:carboxylate-amine ligase
MSELASDQTRSFQHAYGESSPWSLGVEEEFQLVDSTTFALVPRVEEVLGLATAGDRLHIKQELMQSVVEIATGVCATVDDAEAELRALRARVAALAAGSGSRIASSGTHPFSRYELQAITDADRYHDLVDRLQWVAQRELIFGLHVHVGMRSPEQAIYVFNHIRHYLPELLALSANSPYWQGRDTGLASSRSKVFDGFPRSGIPPAFETWDDWTRLIQRAMNAGAMDDYTYVWWDVRPHPRFGTIEVRVCDAQTRVEDSVAIAALVQGLAAHLGTQFDEGHAPTLHPTFLIAENKWSAARHGLEGTMIDFEADRPIPTRDAVRRVIELARPHLRELGGEERLAHVEQMLESSGFERQREWFESGGNVAHVAARIADDTHAVVDPSDRL